MEFQDFCKSTANNLCLEFCPYVNDNGRATTMRATKNLPNPKFFVEFSDLSYNHPYFIAEVFDCERKLYVGTISMEEYDGKKKFEHYETQVSPFGKYDNEFLPTDNEGNSIDGQLWQFYCGNSLKRACNSFLKGGAMTTNHKRKPTKVW